MFWLGFLVGVLITMFVVLLMFFFIISSECDGVCEESVGEENERMD